MEGRKTILIRTYIVYFLCLLFSIAIIFQLVKIQHIDREKYLKEGENAIRWFNIQAPRGSIYSSDGKLLATSVPIFDIRMDLGEQKDRRTNKIAKVVYKDTLNKYINALSDSLSHLAASKKIRPYNKTAAQFKQDILRNYDSNNRYFLVVNSLTYPELMRLKTFPLFRKGKRGGLVLEEFERRERPYGDLGIRTVGKFDTSRTKCTGLEDYYYTVLEGKTGRRQEQKLTNNNWRPLSNDDMIEPERGKDIVSTIDVRLQDVAENALKKCLDSNDALYGCAVIMEVSTGYVHAIANLKRTESGQYIEDYNYAIWDASEPGSTFKLTSVMAVLEEGTLDTNEIVKTGIVNFGSYKMEDSHVKFEKVSLSRAFELSSNTGIAEATDRVFKEKPKEYIKFLSSLGLGKPLGLELKGERSSVIKNRDSNFVWAATLPLMSIGYGVHITPLQLLTLYNAVANDGKMVKPLFAKEIREGGKTVKTMDPVVINPKICSEKTINKLKAMLEGVVQNGTARSLRKSPFRIAGKTGTAQLNYKEKGVEKMRYRASFVGYFPADNPKYSCIVVVVNPQKGRYYGGELAAPVFKEIADKAYALDFGLQKIKQTERRDTVIPFVRAGNANAIENTYHYLQFPSNPVASQSKWVSYNADSNYYKPLKMQNGILPNLAGMTCKDAVELLEKMGVKTMVTGRGKVVSTEPLSGSNVVKGQTVILNLGM